MARGARLVTCMLSPWRASCSLGAPYSLGAPACRALQAWSATSALEHDDVDGVSFAEVEQRLLRGTTWSGQAGTPTILLDRRAGELCSRRRVVTHAKK